MHFDELMKILGEFGKFQKIRFFLLCLISVLSAWHALNLVFVGAAPEFHCKVSDINLTGTRYQGASPDLRKHLFIPEGESCRQFDLDLHTVHGVTNTSSVSARPGNNTGQVECTHGYEFSREYYSETITTEFGLVCEKKSWISISKSVFFCGRLAGALLFGQLSDKYGRRPLFFVGVIMLLTAGTIASFAPNMYVFLPMYFCQGAAHTGTYLVSFILATELVGPSYRVVAGFVSNLFYSTGYIMLAGIAYFVREWRALELVITLPAVFLFSYYWFLPESIRWLLLNGREEEAEEILKKVAKTNKVVLDTDVIRALKDDPSIKAVTSSSKKYSFIDCVRTWRMASLSLNIWFSWMVTALVYYGLSLDTENLAGDPYLNFCVSGAVELPAYGSCLFFLNKLGRRWPLIISMWVGGVACILSGVIPTQGNPAMATVTLVLAMTGKFGITMAYGITYLLAAEVFPTVIRNVGMGVASMSARLGGIMAPQLLRLVSVWTPLPLVVFGGLSLLSGSLAILFPETSGKPLPQTPDDIDFSKQCGSNKKSEKNMYELSDVKV